MFMFFLNFFCFWLIFFIDPRSQVFKIFFLNVFQFLFTYFWHRSQQPNVQNINSISSLPPVHAHQLFLIKCQNDETCKFGISVKIRSRLYNQICQKVRFGKSFFFSPTGVRAQVAAGNAHFFILNATQMKLANSESA